MQIDFNQLYKWASIQSKKEQHLFKKDISCFNIQCYSNVWGQYFFLIF